MIDLPTLEAMLVGHNVRVYIEGDMLTQDYRLDRINIELDKKTRRVRKVWLG
jgi:hypothetical protein